MKVNYNNTWVKQGKKLLPATFKKAIVTAVYPTRYTVDVTFVGNNQTSIKNIPVASSVDINFVAAGDRCKIDVFDETNPNDMVMAYTYSKPSITHVNQGTATVPTSGIAIPHGFSVIPNSITFIKLANPNTSESVSGGGGGTYQANNDVYEYAATDTTNFYLKSTFANISVQWTAIIF